MSEVPGASPHAASAATTARVRFEGSPQPRFPAPAARAPTWSRGSVHGGLAAATPDALRPASEAQHYRADAGAEPASVQHLRQEARLAEDAKHRHLTRLTLADERVEAEVARARQAEAEVDRLQKDLRLLDAQNHALREDLSRAHARLEDAQPKALKYSAAARRLHEIEAEYAAVGRRRDLAAAEEEGVAALQLQHAQVVQERDHYAAQARSWEDRCEVERQHNATLNATRLEAEHVLAAKEARLRELEKVVLDLQGYAASDPELRGALAGRDAELATAQEAIASLEQRLLEADRKEEDARRQAAQEASQKEQDAVVRGHEQKAAAGKLAEELRQEREARERAERHMQVLIDEIARRGQQPPHASTTPSATLPFTYQAYPAGVPPAGIPASTPPALPAAPPHALLAQPLATLAPAAPPLPVHYPPYGAGVPHGAGGHPAQHVFTPMRPRAAAGL